MNATVMGFGIALAIWIACIARVAWSRRIDGMPKAYWAIAVTLCPLLLIAFLLCVEYPRPSFGRNALGSSDG
jgi:ABC-type transport system involved in cytochrome c biogenesis permease subunit